MSPKVREQTTPLWPTQMRTRFSDGRCKGVDNSLWLYKAVPLGPVTDAVTPDAGLAVSEPIMSAMSSLAGMARNRMGRRQQSRNTYRAVHMLLVNVPQRFAPPAGPLSAYLRSSFLGRQVDRRVLLFGVRLRDRIGSGAPPAELVGPGMPLAAKRGSWRIGHVADAVAEVLSTGSVPLEEYEVDRTAVDEALTRAGFRTPKPEDFRLADAWWNHGRAADVPLLEHTDHIHVFSSVEASMSAARLGAEGDKCKDWPPMAGTHALSFGCVADFDLPFVETSDQAANWAAALVDAGAVCVSIRGMVEPAKVTRSELRRHKKRYLDDINERMSQGKMERSEQEETLANLSEVEAAYALDGAPPTLIDTSIITVFSGRHETYGYDLSDVCRDAGVVLTSMESRQLAALKETMLCSSVRAVPHLHDLPAQTVACSGLPSLNIVGDSDGALLGFTERDRQPAYLSPIAASRSDALPLLCVVGATGSGKSIATMFVADQFTRLSRPGIFIDPKQDSDFSAPVLAAGGQVVSLDEVISADGVFDPLRFSKRKEVGTELASSLLLAVNPWGSRREDYETPLAKALNFGVSNGATCIGQALRIALDAGQVADERMVTDVFDLTEARPMFAACVGMQPQTEALRTSETLTLIKVGSQYLELPNQSTADSWTQGQRISAELIRMMVFGSAMALAGRDGFIALDEAWMFIASGGRTEIERLGRLARSMRVLPILMSQRITDAINADLTGYISRGLILHLSDPKEAAAACELFGLEPTPERMSRITDKGDFGGGDASQAGWHSMKALREPGTGKVIRGSVAIYVDLHERAIPVEIRLPDEFLAKVSTNPVDVDLRAGLSTAARW